MNTKEFRVGIDYHQIAVFDPNLDNPFNRWTDLHVQQGFVSRPGSVSFATLSQAANVKVVFLLSRTLALSPGAVRTIVVPFQVRNNQVEVGGLFESVKVGLPSGTYEVAFSAIPAGHDGTVETYFFQFLQTVSPQPRIVLADAELAPPAELCMSAEPA